MDSRDTQGGLGMNTRKRFLLILLGASLLCAGLIFPSAANDETDPYTQSLIDKGFPVSYAEKLTALHTLHPTWEFDPLLVTDMKEQYTWEYVLAQETDNPKRNLVNKGNAYVPYRHETNQELYDSGWYQASYQTVSYFMDPENFLNEKDIFMFQDLCYSETITSEIVESALAGTFMANATLYDDVTYAAYLVEVGKALNVDPLHLAARLRQEQGASGNSPLIKGTCGDKLWYYYENNVQTENGKQILAPAGGHSESALKQYNGLYNYFNIGAAGTGYFAIYLGAMKEAQKGTDEMAEAWGGSGAWDTPAKAIYGGAYKLTNKYVGDYQNTLYLQKFNVDPRSSRNFWGQYMQNVGAAVSEARTIFNSLYTSDCIELPYHFLIPVYQGKPESNPDPANGSCDTYAPADSFVHTETALRAPVSTSPVLDAVTVKTTTMVEGEPITMTLQAHASGAFGRFFVRINGGVLQELPSEYDKASKPTLLDKNGSGRYPNTVYFDCSTLTPGEYNLTFIGQLENPDKACPNYILASIHVSVVKAPETQAPETTETQTDPADTQAPAQSESPAPVQPAPAPEQSGCKGILHASAAALLMLGAPMIKKKK